MMGAEAEEWLRVHRDHVKKSEVVEKAITQIMMGEEAEERAKKLAERRNGQEGC
jgi:hypothetical protein